MSRIWSWVRRDGLLHLETCAMVAVLCGLVAPWWVTGPVAFTAGIGKELWDTRHGVASWHDVICDLIGVVIGTIITAI